MRFRLDAQHYINDRLLEPGHIIGDGTDVPMMLVNGQPLEPSVHMTPLDAEATAFFMKHYPGSTMPERDPMKAIPISANADGVVRQPNQGAGPVDTVDGVPGGYVIGPDGKPTNELKKGLPDSNSPNAPVGRPVIGTVSAGGTTPTVAPPTTAPEYAVTPAERVAGEKAAADKAVADRVAHLQHESVTPFAGFARYLSGTGGYSDSRQISDLIVEGDPRHDYHFLP